MARTKVLPTSIIVRRNEPKRDRRFTSEINVELPVIVQPEVAPKPIDDTSFFGVGRDPQHAWPRRRLYQALAIQDKLSIRATEMAGDPMPQKIPSAMVVGMPAGRMIPATQAVNIEAPGQTSYGALTALNPSIAWSPAYGKLMP